MSEGGQGGGKEVLAAPIAPEKIEGAKKRELIGIENVRYQASAVLDGEKPGQPLDRAKLDGVRARLVKNEAPDTTKITKGSVFEREEFWENLKDEQGGKIVLSKDQQVAKWVKDTNVFLGGFNGKAEETILKKIGMGDGAQALYDDYFKAHKGDLGYFAKKVVDGLDSDEISQNMALLQKIGKFYGEESAVVSRYLVEAVNNLQAEPEKYESYVGTAVAKFGEKMDDTELTFINGIHERGAKLDGKREKEEEERKKSKEAEEKAKRVGLITNDDVKEAIEKCKKIKPLLGGKNYDDKAISERTVSKYDDPFHLLLKKYYAIGDRVVCSAGGKDVAGIVDEDRAKEDRLYIKGADGKPLDISTFATIKRFVEETAEEKAVRDQKAAAEAANAGAAAKPGDGTQPNEGAGEAEKVKTPEELAKEIDEFSKQPHNEMTTKFLPVLQSLKQHDPSTQIKEGNFSHFTDNALRIFREIDKPEMVDKKEQLMRLVMIYDNLNFMTKVYPDDEAINYYKKQIGIFKPLLEKEGVGFTDLEGNDFDASKMVVAYDIAGVLKAGQKSVVERGIEYTLDGKPLRTMSLVLVGNRDIEDQAVAAKSGDGTQPNEAAGTAGEGRGDEEMRQKAEAVKKEIFDDAHKSGDEYVNGRRMEVQNLVAGQDNAKARELNELLNKDDGSIKYAETEDKLVSSRRDLGFGNLIIVTSGADHEHLERMLEETHFIQNMESGTGDMTIVRYTTADLPDDPTSRIIWELKKRYPDKVFILPISKTS